MKKNNFLFAIVIIILITALILRIIDALNKNEDEKVIVENNIVEEIEEKEEIITFKFEIIEPKEGELISSPLLIKGSIVSDNVKEKDLYIVLLDSNSEIVALQEIEIEDAWISDNRVPFSNILEFGDLEASGFISTREKIDNKLLSLDSFKDILINFK